jgi:hypothetical protein
MKIDVFVRAVREPEKGKKIRKKDNNVIFHVCVGAEPLKMASWNLAYLLNPWTLSITALFYLFLRNSFRVPEGQQVHSCRSEDALAQKRCEINAEGRGDGSKKNGRKVVKN